MAEGCELSHRGAIQLVRKYQSDFEELGFLRFEMQENRGTQGAQTEYAVLTEPQATYLITLFRNTLVVRRFKLALVKAFYKAKEEINRLYANPPRQDLLALKRSAHLPLTDAIQEFRELQGKLTDERHYQCENKLCNWVVTGRFAGIEEKELSNEDLLMSTRVRERGAALLVAGMSYPTRKEKLADFGARYRTKMLAVSA